MPTYINPDAIIDHSITSVKLAAGVVPTDASIAAMGYTKNTGTITGITMNGTSKGTSGVVNLGTVITDVSNLATKSAAIGSLSLILDSSDYKITLSGTKVDGTSFTVQNVIDLPLESVVVNGSYNSGTKKVVLTLQNGSTVEFSVADLVAGLQSEITSTNKLSADLIQDGTTNKTVTATEKSTWNSKQNAIGDLDTIRANASAGAAKVSNVQSDWDATTGLAAILHKPTIPSAPGTLNTNNTAAQTASASEALSGTIKLHKIAKTGTYSDLIGTPVMTSDASVAGWGYTKNTGTLTGVKFNGADATVSGSIASITATIPAEVTESTVSGWGFTKNIGTITGVKFNGTTATVSGGIASITATIPAEVTESTVSGWGFTKNAGTLTGIKFNGTDATISGSIASISATIPAAPGTLKTNNTSAQTASASESLSGTINLHKVAKTGTYSDLIGTPAEVTSSTVSGWGFTKNNGTITGITMNGSSKGTSGVVDLGTVITSETSLSKGNTSGSGNAVTDIAVSGHQITLTKGSTFLTSHQSIKTINGNTMTGSGNVSINELPAVTSSDNGKVLMVVNGAWSTVTPVSIYSGSSAPNNSQGINGDIYLQV